MGFFNFEILYNEYNNCHNNTINKVIHILTNPIIIMCILILGFYLNISQNNISNIIIVMYIMYYFMIRIKLGIIMLINFMIIKEIAYYIFFIFPDIWFFLIPILTFFILLQSLSNLIFRTKYIKNNIISSILIVPIYHILEVCFAFNFFNDIRQKILKKND